MSFTLMIIIIIFNITNLSSLFYINIYYTLLNNLSAYTLFGGHKRITITNKFIHSRQKIKIN